MRLLFWLCNIENMSLFVWSGGVFRIIAVAGLRFKYNCTILYLAETRYDINFQIYIIQNIIIIIILPRPS